MCSMEAVNGQKLVLEPDGAILGHRDLFQTGMLHCMTGVLCGHYFSPKEKFPLPLLAAAPTIFKKRSFRGLLPPTNCCLMQHVGLSQKCGNSPSILSPTWAESVRKQSSYWHGHRFSVFTWYTLWLCIEMSQTYYWFLYFWPFSSTVYIFPLYPGICQLRIIIHCSDKVCCSLWKLINLLVFKVPQDSLLFLENECSE